MALLFSLELFDDLQPIYFKRSNNYLLNSEIHNVERNNFILMINNFFINKDFEVPNIAINDTVWIKSKTKLNILKGKLVNIENSKYLIEFTDYKFKSYNRDQLEKVSNYDFLNDLIYVDKFDGLNLLGCLNNKFDSKISDSLLKNICLSTKCHNFDFSTSNVEKLFRKILKETITELQNPNPKLKFKRLIIWGSNPESMNIIK